MFCSNNYAFFYYTVSGLDSEASWAIQVSRIESSMVWFLEHFGLKFFVSNLTLSVLVSQLSTPNFSLHNSYKIKYLVKRKWELIKQSKLLKIKITILLSLFNEKYGLSWENFTIQLGLKGLISKFSREHVSFFRSPTNWLVPLEWVPQWPALDHLKLRTYCMYSIISTVIL